MPIPLPDRAAAARAGIALVPPGTRWSRPDRARERPYPLLRTGCARTQARSRANAAIAAVKLTESANHLVEEFSGGQQQRVAIVAEGPRPGGQVLLADEPTRFDATNRESIVAARRRPHRGDRPHGHPRRVVCGAGGRRHPDEGRSPFGRRQNHTGNAHCGPSVSLPPLRPVRRAATYPWPSISTTRSPHSPAPLTPRGFWRLPVRNAHAPSLKSLLRSDLSCPSSSRAELPPDRRTPR